MRGAFRIIGRCSRRGKGNIIESKIKKAPPLVDDDDDDDDDDSSGAKSLPKVQVIDVALLWSGLSLARSLFVGFTVAGFCGRRSRCVLLVIDS